MNRLIRRPEAAELLGVSIRTLSRWHDSGVLRRVKIGPRLVGYDPEDLRRLMSRDRSADELAGGER